VIQAKNIRRFDQHLHGFQPDDNLHPENGGRDVAIECHFRKGTDVQEFKLSQRVALQRRWGFPILLHVVECEKNGTPSAIGAVDQHGAIEIILQ